MTTGRINQVHASPRDWSTLKTLTCAKVARKPCGTSPQTPSKFQHCDAWRNAAHNQHLHNDPDAQDDQTSKRCIWKPCEIWVLHALMLSFTIYILTHNNRMVSSHSLYLSSPSKSALQTFAAVQPQTGRTFRGGHV